MSVCIHDLVCFCYPVSCLVDKSEADENDRTNGNLYFFKSQQKGAADDKN